MAISQFVICEIFTKRLSSLTPFSHLKMRAVVGRRCAPAMFTPAFGGD
jgi:hypothetical protein